MSSITEQITVFYVATDGQDSWTGQLPAPNDDGTDGPFASIAEARDAIRDIKASGPLGAPVTVLIRGGTYYLDETVVFGPLDSGTRECPVTYAAFPGETPVLSGGEPLSGEWKTVTELPGWEGRGIPDGLRYLSRSADEGGFRNLSVNGRRKRRTRTPGQGYYETEEAVTGTSFRYRDGDLDSFHAMDDVEVVVIHSWNESRLRVRSFDPSSRLVECYDPEARHEIGWTGTRGQNRYYVENVIEGLGAPGEWYLDRKASVLYYTPEDGEDLDAATVVASRLRQVFRFEGDLDRAPDQWMPDESAEDQMVRYVRLEGLTICDTDWDLPENGYPDCGDVGDIVDPATVTFEAAAHCEVRNLTIHTTGTYALEVNGFDCRVEECEIYDTGSGGIVTRNYHAPENVFRYNHIHHCGHVYHSGVGINIDDGGGLFENNLVHDITHSGIYGRHWATATQAIERRNQKQELRIEANEIYDVATMLDDAGGIFIRDSNIVIRGNLIHDVHSGHKRCPGWGIYLGCETRDTLVERNLVHNCLESVHVWYKDRNVTITNNIFVGSEQFQINFGNPEHLGHENVRLLCNVIYCTNTKGRLYTVFGKRSLPAVSDRNLLFSAIGCVLNDPVITKLEGVDSFTDWRGLGLDSASITADPKFVDPEHHDYRLQADSPAWALGFQPLDFRAVGLRGKAQ